MSSTSREDIFKLDFELGNIDRKVEVLNDIKDSMGQLCIGMDEAVYRGTQNLEFNGFRSKVRILSELVRYVVNELVEDVGRATTSCSSVFKEIRNTQKEEEG